jgi:transposase InsO family protein
MSERMTADLVCDALQMAVFKRKRPKGVIVHSDRGSQYCSHAYRQLLEQHQLQGSMSAKGNCYDNACAESFFQVCRQNVLFFLLINSTNSTADFSYLIIIPRQY